MVLSWARRMQKYNEYGIALFIIAGAAGLMFISMNALTAYLFFCGAGIALVRIRRRQQQSHRSWSEINTIKLSGYGQRWK